MHPLFRSLRRSGSVALVLFASADALFAPPTSVFNPVVSSGLNTFSFTDVANWTAGTIGNVFNYEPAEPQHITFDASMVAPSGGLTFNLDGVGGMLTLRGAGGTRTLTFQGSDGVSVNSSGGSAISLGSTSMMEELQLILESGTHAFDVGDYDLLTVANGTVGEGRLQKTGNGRMIVTGSAAHAGGTAVDGGTLQIGDGTNAATLAGNVDLSGFSTLEFKPSAAAAFAGNISGDGSLRVSGTGMLTLTGANTHTQATTVGAGAVLVAGAAATLSGASTVIVEADGFASRGVLRIDENQTIPWLVSTGESPWDAAVEIADGKVLTIESPGGEPAEFAGAISGGLGTLVKNGDGGQILSGQNSYGATEVRGGFLQIGGSWGDGVLPGDVTILSGGELRFAPSETTSYSGAISGGGQLTVGSGQLNLDGGNGGFAGQVEIEAGAGLSLRSPGAIGTQAAVSIEGEGEWRGILELRADLTVASLEGTPDAEVRFAADEIASLVATLRTLTVNGSADTVFAGTITGDGALVKTGTGRLTLTGASEYGGGTTVNGGVLALENVSGSATGTGLITVGAAGELRLGSGSTSSGGVVGPVVNNGVVTFDTMSGTYSSEISGVGQVRIAALGQVTLTGENSYVGGTVLESGATLELASPSGGTLAAGGDVTLGDGSVLRVGTDQTVRGLDSDFSGSSVEIAGDTIFTVNLPTEGSSAFAGTIVGDSGAVLKKEGPGTLYFLGTANPDFANPSSAGYGQTPLSAWVGSGTLQIGDGGVDGIFLGDITVDSAGKVVVDRSDDNEFPFSFAGTGEVVKQGASDLTLTGENTFTGTLTIEDGTITVGADHAAAAGVRVVTNAGGTFAVGAGVTTGITVAGLTGTGATTIAAGKKLTVETVEPQSYAGAISGDGSLRKRGTAAYALSGANAYLGDTWIENGTLIAAAEGALSPGSVFRVNSGATLQVNSSNSIAGLDDFNPGASGTVNVTSAAVLTIDNGISNTFSGALAGAGGLTKAGAGTLAFAGGSTFSGAVRIEEGTIAVGAPVAFTAGEVTVEAGGMFDVANSTSVASLAGEGMTLVRAGATLTLAAPGILDSDITGAGGVTFQNGNQSTAVTTVTRTQGFTGATSVAAGTLRFAGSSEAVGENIYGSDISLGAGTKVEFSRSDSLYGYSGAISGSGSVVKTGEGTLVLSGASSYSGQTSVGGGTLKAAATNALPATTRVAVANGATLNVAADQTINGFVGGGSFLGSIVVEAAQVLNVTLGGAEWATEFGGVISGDGALRVGRSDFGHAVMLTGSNTYTGGTTIDEDGALVLGTGFSPGGSIVGNVVNNGVLTFQPGNNVVFGGVISGTGRVTHGLATGGPDLAETRLTAANTYAGGTRVYGGVLFAMNANPSESATGSGLVEVLDGGILAGTGRVAGPLVVDFGGIVAPASALGTPGTLRVGPTTFGGEGEFIFQIADADGVAGTDYSLLAISGQLALTATGADRFAIQMFSVGASGGVANFDPEQAYSWMFVTTTGGISGFDPVKFDFDLENFSVGLTGSFSVGHVENSLLINYSPAAIPEPSTWVLLGAGLAVLLLVFRGRVRRG